MADDQTVSNDNDDNDDNNGTNDQTQTDQKDIEQDVLDVNGSKQEMATAITNLISTFQDETQLQDKLLTSIQNESSSNPSFGNINNSQLWTINEVCHWLTTIDCSDYIYSFHSKSINGNILLNNININILKNELNVNDIHSNKILKQIDILKINKNDHKINKNNVNDIIASIKKENEDLLSQLNQQKELNKKLKKKQIHNINSNDYHIIKDKQITNKSNKKDNNQSLSTIIAKQNQIIQDFGKQIKQIQTQSHKKIKELQKKNKELQDGYITLETHYQLQLTNLQNKMDKLISSNNRTTADNSSIGLLWNENDLTNKELLNEKEMRNIAETELKQTQILLNREIQKRKLLESQTSRLTQELTKYLQPKSRSNSPIPAALNKFKRFNIKRNKNNNNNNNNNNKIKSNKLNKQKNNTKTNINKQNNDDNDNNSDEGHEKPTGANSNAASLRRKPSMEAKAGWLKFLQNAAENRKIAKNAKLAAKSKGKDVKNDKKKRSFHIPSQLSVSNIKEKFQKKDQNINNGNMPNIDENVVADNGGNGQKIQNVIGSGSVSVSPVSVDDDNPNNIKHKHVRKSTLGQTVMATFKKVKNAAAIKMEERAIKRKQRKTSSGTGNNDKGDIANTGFISIDPNNNKGNDNDNNDNNINDNDHHDIDFIDNDNDNIDAIDDDNYNDQLNSNAQHKIIITNENNKAIVDYDTDDSIVLTNISGNNDIHSSITMEFAPALQTLPQTQELDVDKIL